MVASLIGAVIGGATSLLAGRKQARAASSAAALQQRQFQQTRADMAPWREAGANALAELAALYGLSGEDARQAALSRFRTSPGFGFRLAEGQRALDRSAAARGMLLSGNQLRALAEYGQSLAAKDYGGYANRLAALAGIGQSATEGTARLGADAAAAQGRFGLAAGDARAGGISGAGNAIAAMLRDERFRNLFA